MDVYIPFIRDSGDEKSPDTHIELKSNPYIGAAEIARCAEMRILQKMEGYEDDQRKAD